VDYFVPEPDYLFAEQLFRAILRADRMSEPSHQQIADVPMDAPKPRKKRRTQREQLYPYVHWYENAQGYGYWRCWDCRRRTYELFHDTPSERVRAVAFAKELEPLRRKRRARV
jgi:hypothetical protein